MIINLTPHTITEVTSGRSFEPSGQVCRVKLNTIKTGEADGCPIYETDLQGSIEGLPPKQEGIYYIVSSIVLNVLPSNRNDVLSPGNLQRDQEGNPIGCIGFRRNKK